MIRNLNKNGNLVFYLVRGTNDDDQSYMIPVIWDEGEGIMEMMKIPDPEYAGVEFFGRSDDPRQYFVVYNDQFSKPYPAVLVFKFEEDGDDRVIIDVDENDVDFVSFIRNEYLSADLPGDRIEMTIKPDLTEGEVELLVRLGFEFEKGLLFQKDYDAARTCYDIAARHGSALAVNNYAWLFQNGLGVNMDIPLAVKLYELAAEGGCARALVNLGNIYEFGELGEKDYKKAFGYYRQAARAKEPKGLYNYANCLHYGHGTRKNYKKAFEIFKYLADKDLDDEAFFYVGLYYQEGMGTSRDYKAALKYYRKGAKAGQAYCCNQLGVMYGKGQGVKKNVKKALEYYKTAARLGDALAYSNIGWIYESGALGESDPSKALSYYEIGAGMGDRYSLEGVERLTNRNRDADQ